MLPKIALHLRNLYPTACVGGQRSWGERTAKKKKREKDSQMEKKATKLKKKVRNVHSNKHVRLFAETRFFFAFIPHSKENKKKKSEHVVLVVPHFLLLLYLRGPRFWVLTGRPWLHWSCVLFHSFFTTLCGWRIQAASMRDRLSKRKKRTVVCLDRVIKKKKRSERGNRKNSASTEYRQRKQEKNLNGEGKVREKRG